MVKVRRSQMLFDGMAAFEKVGGGSIKDRMVVKYLNDFGEEEAGIDIGGLFKGGDYYIPIYAYIYVYIYVYIDIYYTHIYICT
jgi:hypothetical protein